MLRILCIGTEWFSKNGGLSTFNRLLCLTLAKYVQVYCYVPEYNQEEFEDANNNNVKLLRPKRIPGMELMALLNNKPMTSENIDFDVIIGHDKVTGPQMHAVWGNFYSSAKKVLFIHTAPSELEWLKPEKMDNNPASTAEQKETTQKDLAKDCDLIVAVGPKLHGEIRLTLSGLTKKPKITRFDPGLYYPPDEDNYNFDSEFRETLLMGRVEDFKLKGVDIGFIAMDTVYRNWKLEVNNMVVRPRMVIRGAKIGAENLLIAKFASLIPDSKLNLKIKNYSANVDVINDDIRRSSLVLMPSRAEGFGLVALEALSLGRPILISQNSGLAMLIYELAPEQAEYWIIPSDLEKDGIERWAEMITEILTNRPEAVLRLKALIKVFTEKISWSKSVETLIGHINSFLSEVKKINNLEETKPVHSKGIENPIKSEGSLKKLLDMQFGTKLVDTFLGLPVTRRFKIAEELGLLETGEIFQGTTLDKLSSKFIERAIAKNLLAELWSKIFPDSTEPNPFKK